MLKGRARSEAALQLRIRGFTYQDIANALGYASRSSALYAIKAAMARHEEVEAASVEELRRIDLLRLDKMLRGHWDRATSGNSRAAETVLKIMARRAALVGLDKQQPPAPAVSIGWFDGMPATWKAIEALNQLETAGNLDDETEAALRKVRDALTRSQPEERKDEHDDSTNN